MDYLNRLRQTACTMGVEDFVAAHDGLYLLGFYPQPDEDETESCILTSHGRPWTAIPDRRVAKPAQETPEQEEMRRLQGIFLLRIGKSHRNPWRGRISVGRASNNDLVVRHPSVSKLHAHFVLESGRGEASGGTATLQLADVGSSNGTCKNGHKLPPGELRAVTSGDVLHFGDVRCELWDASALHEQIRSRIPTRDLRERTASGG
jgi:hypothetical protein